MELPILYKKDISGRVWYWECRVTDTMLETRAGLLKTRAKHKWKEHTKGILQSGSNKSPEERAIEHARSKWKEKKRNDNVVENLSDLDNNRYAMPIIAVSAKRYTDLQEMNDNPGSKYKFNPDYPYLVQPKLDGERAISHYIGGKIYLYSRLRNPIPYLDHIKIALQNIHEDLRKTYAIADHISFDGEIMEPEGTRNSMRSAISTVKIKHANNGKLVYHIFDLVMGTKPKSIFTDRYRLLSTILGKYSYPCLKLVPLIGKAILGTSDIDQMLNNTVQLGYEGIILRDPAMTYPTVKTRSYQMIKYKPFKDEEYTIIDAIEGSDAHTGLIIFHVRDIRVSHLKFYVTPAMPHKERSELWMQYKIDPSSIVGKLLTVRYREKNEYGIPLEPIGCRIRDEGDMTETEALE